MWDLVEDGVDGEGGLFGVGVEASDRLQRDQKLSLLVDLGRALEDETTPCPKLTSRVEATAAAVFRLVLREIRMEIDLESGDVDGAQCWRRLVRDAIDATSNDDQEEGGGLEEDRLVAPTSKDFEMRSAYVDNLAERVLWDEDFEREDVPSTTRPNKGGLDEAAPHRRGLLRRRGPRSARRVGGASSGFDGDL
jgi:hypothetical protein